MRRVRFLPFRHLLRRVSARAEPVVAERVPAAKEPHESLHHKLARSRDAKRGAVAYDSVEWHTAIEFPEDLPAEAAATHIGMFVGWCIERGHVGDFHVTENQRELLAVRAGTLSPARFVLDVCEGIFWEEDLDELGNAFAAEYYAGDLGYGPYLHDYATTLANGLPSLYHVADLPEHRARMRERVDARFEAWRRRREQRSIYNALA